MLINFGLQESVSQYSSCDQIGEKFKNTNENVTSSSAQLFASLADYDIFYRWKRTNNRDSVTNHNRKTRTADKKAPLGKSNESDASTFVRHFIILRPSSNISKDEETKGSKLTGKTHFIVQSFEYVAIENSLIY